VHDPKIRGLDESPDLSESEAEVGRLRRPVHPSLAEDEGVDAGTGERDTVT
jgi:hypothetical protein